jgi:flavin reductase (DIM6/NTAB) family NADH-FMN oxidoreductase RutF
MARRTLKGGAMLAPLPPALVSVGTEECPNLITIGWTGITATIPPSTYISVRPERFSHHLLMENGEFVIHLASEDLAPAVDFCGMYTGEKVDKFEKCALTKVKSTYVSCPTVEECPVAIECRVREVKNMGSHDVFFADILGVTVDEKLFDENGKIHLEWAHLIAYMHGEYFALGKKIGKFGYSATKGEKGGVKGKVASHKTKKPSSPSPHKKATSKTKKVHRKGDKK